MMEQKKKRKINMSIFLPRILFCGLLLYLGVWFIVQQFSAARYDKELEKYNEEYAEQQRIHEELEAEMEKTNDPEYIERVAREKLGYMKPDEKVFIDIKKPAN